MSQCLQNLVVALSCKIICARIFGHKDQAAFDHRDRKYQFLLYIIYLNQISKVPGEWSTRYMSRIEDSLWSLMFDTWVNCGFLWCLIPCTVVWLYRRTAFLCLPLITCIPLYTVLWCDKYGFIMKCIYYITYHTSVCAIIYYLWLLHALIGLHPCKLHIVCYYGKNHHKT